MIGLLRTCPATELSPQGARVVCYTTPESECSRLFLAEGMSDHSDATAIRDWRTAFICKHALDGGRTHNLCEEGGGFLGFNLSRFLPYRFNIPSVFVTACYTGFVMASTYLRSNSPVIWFRFKDERGKWVAKPSEYRKDNIGDRRQAKLVALKMGIAERERQPASSGQQWDAWVDGWLRDRYGTQSGTLVVYRRYWKRLRVWLEKDGVTTPLLLNYAAVLRCKEKRLGDGVGINTIVHELKFLGVVMSEAIRRFNLQIVNPCLKLGFRRTRQEGKVPWTPEQVATVAKEVKGEADWMQATFLLGYYQAARLRQCEVPLKDIDLTGKKPRITYWRTLGGRALTKGDKPFSQPLAKSAVQQLRELVEKRKAGGFADLCTIPVLPSVEWRNFLNRFGFGAISHHGLRTTWITRAALSRKISREEAKAFVNHGSTAVHEIYQRLNIDDLAHVADALNLPDFA